jgi:hypothetical protein
VLNNMISTKNKVATPRAKGIQAQHVLYIDNMYRQKSNSSHCPQQLYTASSMHFL